MLAVPLIAEEKEDREEKKNIDYGTSYTFWIVDPDTVTLSETRGLDRKTRILYAKEIKPYFSV